MKYLVEFELEEGGSILVEVDGVAESGMVPVSRGDKDVVTRAQHSFEAALDKVRPAAQTIIKKLRSLHDPPDEVEVEFGLKMSAEAGAVIASGGVEANYTVKLTWKREKK